jgi:hypothetical protein
LPHDIWIEGRNGAEKGRKKGQKKGQKKGRKGADYSLGKLKVSAMGS